MLAAEVTRAGLPGEPQLIGVPADWLLSVNPLDGQKAEALMERLPQIALKYKSADGRSDNPPPPSSVNTLSDDRTAAARKAVFLEQTLIEWCAGKRRNPSQAFTRDEIAEMASVHRLLAQHHSLMANFSHYFASTERADVALGVLLLVTLLCDNPRGCCTLSVPRIAKFYGRSERAISEAVARLEDAQVIFVERKPHSPNQYWPVINRAFGGHGVPAMWFVDARAPARANGRPRAPLPLPPEPGSGGFSVTPRTRAHNPPNPASPNLSSYLSKEKKINRDEFEIGEDGVLTLHGALREEWLGRFYGNPDLLAAGLEQAAGWLPQSPTLAKVRSQLAIACRMTPKPKQQAATPSSYRPKGLAMGAVSTLCGSPDASGKLQVYRSREPDAFNAWVQHYEDIGAQRMVSLALKTECVVEKTRLPPPVRSPARFASCGAAQ